MHRSPLTWFLLAPTFLSVVFFTSCERDNPQGEQVKAALDGEETSGDAEPIVADPVDIPPPPEPVPMEPVVNKAARVSILGYHDFTAGKTTNDMVINIGDFRDQMQAIKDAQKPVISMREFLDWKRGKNPIPDQSVMITIDDGWKATHSLAMDVLKEFNYPFTVFLYKNYIGIGGKSMTHEEIRELAAAGATLSSHSVSHHNLSDRKGRSAEAYTAWLKEELEESHHFLVEEFGDTGAVEKVFAFPYGIYNDQVTKLAKEFGYEACFTVNGKKSPWNTENMEIGRYIVHGTTLANFDPALNFGGSYHATASHRLMTETINEDGSIQSPLVTVMPPVDSNIGNRLPLIEIDLSRLPGVQPESISMRISGFGKVPHQYDYGTGRALYQVPQRLRLDTYEVQFSFRHANNPENEVISWSFTLEQIADYIDAKVTSPGKNAPLEIPPSDENSAVPEASPASDTTPSI
jgi:peptidoglycan/xylan/chitin deacetylase (PgdA/CDA1 family)